MERPAFALVHNFTTAVERAWLLLAADWSQSEQPLCNVAAEIAKQKGEE